MENFEFLENRINNDIASIENPDVYLINQEGDKNCFNSFKKKSKTKTIDGGTIVKNSSNYYGCFSYDLGKVELIKGLKLRFISYSEHSGINFLDYINSVLTADPKIFVRLKGLLVQDIRKYLLEVTRIDIIRTTVDNILIQNISKYFKNLEFIEFHNCTIKKECNFNTLNCNIKVTESIIENINSFSEFKGDIDMIRTNIDKISPTNILSEKLLICHGNFKNEEIKLLFLSCNFPNLKEFRIDSITAYANYSFEDSFTYLPSSAPKLEKLIIKGKIKSLNFLTQFKYLIDCTILSIYDDWSMFNPYITDGKEREKIKKNNKLQIEIQKILNPNEDLKYIETTTEFNRILKIIKTNQLLSYTNEEKEFLLSHLDLIKYYFNNIQSGNIDNYYRRYFDSLELNKVDSDIDCLLGTGHKIKILNNILYFYQSIRDIKKEIVVAHNYIYYIDGKPIIFDEKYRKQVKIDTIEKARAFMNDKRVSSFNLDESYYQDFLKLLNELKQEDKDIAIGDLINAIETFDIKVCLDIAFKKLGNKNIMYVMDYYNRLLNREKDLKNKERKYKELLYQLIFDNYDKFNIEEKKCLYNDIIQYDHTFLFHKEIDSDESYLETIDKKTNGLYKKYKKIIDLIQYQENVLGSPNDVKISQKILKQI